MNLAQRIGQEFKTLRDDELSTKQESLVSGTNIKTINGASVLGSGDIDLSTLSGYGITDAYTKTEIDSIYGDIASLLDTINGEVI